MSFSFDNFVTQLLQQGCETVSYSQAVPPRGHDGYQARMLLGVCAVAVANRGIEWCLCNPKSFFELVRFELGSLVNLTLVFESTAGERGVWIALIRWLLPEVLTFLRSERVQEINWLSLASEAKQSIEEKQ